MAARPVVEPRKTLKALLDVNQINIGHCHSAALDLRVTNIRQGIDVTLIQEPYTRYGKIQSFGAVNRIIASKPDRKDPPQAAIIISNPNLDVMCLGQYTTTHCAVAAVSTSNEKYIFVSLYCQYSDPIEPYLEQIDRIASENPKSKIIIGSDLNAKSPLWYSKTTDDAGKAAIVCFAKSNLHPVNTAQDKTTFKGRRTCGRNLSVAIRRERQMKRDANPQNGTNIDVTATSANMATRIFNWRVQEGPNNRKKKP